MLDEPSATARSAKIDQRDAASILLVDDDPDVCLSIAEALEDDGFLVTMAPDGEGALRLILQEEFDLVISDLHLRGNLSGGGLTRKIRGAGSMPPIVAISGDLETEYDVLLEKPCGTSEILAAVAEALARRTRARK